MDETLFDRILLPLADPDDAERTARAIRPYLDEETTLIITHVTQGEAAGTTVAMGRDRFAEEIYETFIAVLGRQDLTIEWVTLEGRDVSEAIIDAIGTLEATLMAFTPRDLDTWSRTLAGDPGSRLVRDADIPVMVFPSRTE
ncbi:universal stress protein [Natronomonas salsuginis]|jgi:nucleotide-binding universal stress UspA family protein|uniref:Universal stress protein n=1 Tax=Natronomonas salsuginis TaxID=2217661 RepID=A0A4U5JA87_9EURY|nr:universal stress protein [Natronomonas salsuginis]TKR25435.1 universal stress protein [Natronomonas salsuginis]